MVADAGKGQAGTGDSNLEKMVSDDLANPLLKATCLLGGRQKPLDMTGHGVPRGWTDLDAGGPKQQVERGKSSVELVVERHSLLVALLGQPLEFLSHRIKIIPAAVKAVIEFLPLQGAFPGRAFQIPLLPE